VEKVLHLKDLKMELFQDQKPNEEYLLWATTAPGLHMSRKCYEVLETYGDTCLKFASTMLAYWYKRNDRRAGEGEIENAKVCFITNFHLFRVGNNQMFQRWMKSKKDVEHKDFEIPMQNAGTKETQHLKYIKNCCVGKNVTDAVEALICALYLSTGCLRSCLDWIHDIKLVPIKLTQDDMLGKFAYNVDYSLGLYKPLKVYNFDTNDHVKDIFTKYFAVEGDSVDPSLRELILGRMEMSAEDIGELGDVYEHCRQLKGRQLIDRALLILEDF
jgi:dsRNA-specific ribonuclease